MSARYRLTALVSLALIVSAAHAYVGGPPEDAPEVVIKVDFTTTLQDWDGFGVNYVELAQSTDPVNDPQEYGGFSSLSRRERVEILDLIFGEDGLQPNIIKMFLDPFHQAKPGGEFDHESTTEWMRYFAREGVKRTRQRDSDIEIITTLYGPPPWATKQKFLRGRDLDPQQLENLARYMIDWLAYLVHEEDLPVNYLSLHNEGDSPNRWPNDAASGNMERGHDYNAYWRPHQVVLFLEFLPAMLAEAGLVVGVTPGEPTYWRNFANHWYDRAILDNVTAMNNLALITSHGFGRGSAINSVSVDLLRWKRPELHAWTTSMTWGESEETPAYDFVNVMRRNIYDAKVNAIIPWAVVKTSSWVGGDPNAATAIFVTDEGEFEVRPHYYFYKQLTRAGQRGMKVATVETASGSGIELIAFTSNGTRNTDAFVVLNTGESDRELKVEISGSGQAFSATRTSETEHYVRIGQFMVEDGTIAYVAPAGSVSTFVAR